MAVYSSFFTGMNSENDYSGRLRPELGIKGGEFEKLKF
jgi:hypothetical protein